MCMLIKNLRKITSEELTRVDWDKSRCVDHCLQVLMLMYGLLNTIVFELNYKKIHQGTPTNFHKGIHRLRSDQNFKTVFSRQLNKQDARCSPLKQIHFSLSHKNTNMKHEIKSTALCCVYSYYVLMQLTQ